MLYLNDQHLRARPIDWHALADILLETLSLIDRGHYAQPIKPYLRYKHPKNRIISMPAYVGGNIDKAGIKWIASFPDNPRIGLPRAHSVIVLNNADTGRPEAILNSPLPSIARTAAISSIMMRAYLNSRHVRKINLGIIGWGPIGQHHAKMATSLFGDHIESIRIYDLKPIHKKTLDPAWESKTMICDQWEDVYEHANIFITCTVSSQRYIDRQPPKGSLLLNVSLRDYMPDVASSFKAVIVDDWDEVCREHTDIEQLHLHHGLTKSATVSLADVVFRNRLNEFELEEPIFFNPMGMACFDIATAVYYVELAKMQKFGLKLE